MLTLVNFLQCGNEFRFPSEPKLTLKDFFDNEDFMRAVREANRQHEIFEQNRAKQWLLRRQQMEGTITYEWGNSSAGSYVISNSALSPFVYRVKA